MCSSRYDRDIDMQALELSQMRATCSLVRIHEVEKANKIDMLKIKSTMESDYVKKDWFLERES